MPHSSEPRNSTQPNSQAIPDDQEQTQIKEEEKGKRVVVPPRRGKKNKTKKRALPQGEKGAADLERPAAVNRRSEEPGVGAGVMAVLGVGWKVVGQETIKIKKIKRKRLFLFLPLIGTLGLTYILCFMYVIILYFYYYACMYKIFGMICICPKIFLYFKT